MAWLGTQVDYRPESAGGRIRALPPERRLQAAAVVQTVLLPPEGGVPIRRQPEIRGQCADAPSAGGHTMVIFNASRSAANSTPLISPHPPSRYFCK